MLKVKEISLDDVRILKILKKVQKSPNDKDKWARYKKQRNYVTRIFRQAEADYWKYKFENANGSGEFWKIVREMKGQKKGNIGSIREKEGVILNDDKEKAESLNQFFAEIGQKLATNIQPDALFGEKQHFHRITPTISNISIDKTVVSKCIEKRMKPGKSCGSDNVLSKDLKIAGTEAAEGLTNLMTKITEKAEYLTQ